MNNQIRLKHVEQTKNCGIKIDYKNSASRWSLTHWILLIWELTNSAILFSDLSIIEWRVFILLCISWVKILL